MRDRSRVINIEISEKAKDIYNNLAHNIKKGEWVSEAIIEKHSREQSGGYVTLEQYNKDIAELTARLEKVEGRK